MTQMMKQMTAMVKDQKRTINELTEKNQMAYSVFEVILVSLFIISLGQVSSFGTTATICIKIQN